MVSGDRSGHFDRVARTYDEARPAYPQALWDVLTDERVLLPGADVLELGAGSGQATVPLLDAGARVTAVEPGPALAGMLRERISVREAVVVEAVAEELELAGAAYDAVVAATSFHWLDRDVLLPRLHATLRPEGLLAVWWTVFGAAEVTTPFRERVARIARRHGLDRQPRRTDALDTALWTERLEAGGWFAVRRAEVLPWSIDLSAHQVRGLFATFPTWPDAALAEIEDAARETGEPVTEHYATAVYVAGRT